MASTASVVIGHEAVPLHQITPIGGCVGAGNCKPTLVALYRPDDSDNVMAVTASRQTREVHAASRLTLSAQRHRSFGCIDRPPQVASRAEGNHAHGRAQGSGVQDRPGRLTGAHRAHRAQG